MCAYFHSKDDAKNAQDAVSCTPDFLLDDFDDYIMEHYRERLQNKGLEKDLFSIIKESSHLDKQKKSNF